MCAIFAYNGLIKLFLGGGGMPPDPPRCGCFCSPPLPQQKNLIWNPNNYRLSHACIVVENVFGLWWSQPLLITCLHQVFTGVMNAQGRPHARAHKIVHCEALPTSFFHTTASFEEGNMAKRQKLELELDGRSLVTSQLSGPWAKVTTLWMTARFIVTFTAR